MRASGPDGPGRPGPAAAGLAGVLSLRSEHGPGGGVARRATACPNMIPASGLRLGPAARAHSRVSVRSASLSHESNNINNSIVNLARIFQALVNSFEIAGISRRDYV